MTSKESRSDKGLCNNYLVGGGGGGWKIRGGHRRDDNKREVGLDVKFNAYRGAGAGALLFHSFLQTGKVVEELLEFKYKYKHWNKTDKFINSKVC